MQESRTRGLDPCPAWCRREHGPDDHPEDLRHQGAPATMAVLLASSAPPSTDARAVEAVAYADQPHGAAGPWIRVESLESRDLRMALSPDSARELVRALNSVLGSIS